MPTAIGANTLTSVSRQFVMPTIPDAVYNSNVFLYRLLKANKRMVQGGTQIEVPHLYKRFNTGGTYRGFEVLNTAPQDTVKSLVFDWKQYYQTVAVDGLTLIKNDSPDSIASIITLNTQQAYMEMAEDLATDLFNDGLTDIKAINGFRGAVGNGSVGDTNYGGINRTSETWNNSVVDASTSTMTYGALQTWFSNGQVGGHHYTLIASRADQYNRYIALHTAAGSGYSVQQTRSPLGHDEMLASAGFTNALFNNVPWVVDSHVDDGPNTSNSRIYGFNENVISLVVSPRADFHMEDFQRPVNQDAFVSTLLWAGNIVSMNNRLHGVLTNISA